jgi:hypothetical protein
MDRFEGTSARQLPLLPDDEEQFGEEYTVPVRPAAPKRSLRLLQKDVFTELSRRRRRAQIAARHLLESQ